MVSTFRQTSLLIDSESLSQHPPYSRKPTIDKSIPHQRYQYTFNASAILQTEYSRHANQDIEINELVGTSVASIQHSLRGNTPYSKGSPHRLYGLPSQGVFWRLRIQSDGQQPAYLIMDTIDMLCTKVILRVFGLDLINCGAVGEARRRQNGISLEVVLGCIGWVFFSP